MPTTNFNLLPEEKRINKNVWDSLKIIRALGTISLAIFLVGTVASVGLFFYYRYSLNNINNRTAALTDQINAYKTSESQIILLKDRISKISEVQKLPDGSDNFSRFEGVIANMDDKSSVQSLIIDPKLLEFTVLSTSNQSISNFVRYVSGLSGYDKIKVGAMLFAKTGFTTVFDLQQKE